MVKCICKKMAKSVFTLAVLLLSVIPLCAQDEALMREVNAIIKNSPDDFLIQELQKKQPTESEKNRIPLVVKEVYRRIGFNPQNTLGETFYHRIAATGMVSFLKIPETYRSQTSDINALTKKGLSPLHYAIKYNKKNVHEVFTTFGALGVDFKYKAPNGDNLLHMALQKMLSEITGILVLNNVSVEDKNQASQSPMMMALLNKDKKSLMILLEKGAKIPYEPFKRGYSTTSYIHEVAIYGWLDLLRKVDKTHINVTNSSGYTALHQVVEKNKKDVLETVDVLKELGADFTAVTEYKDNSLHLAVKHKNATLVQKLIENGTPVNALNKYGLTPLHGAFRYVSKEVIDKLLAAGAKMDTTEFSTGMCESSTALHSCAANGWADLVTNLLNSGVDVNIQLKKSDHHKGASPLLFAVLNQQTEIVKLLLDRGADVNISETWLGYSPLTAAIRKRDTVLFDLLLAKGADVNLATSNGFPIYDCFLSEFPKEGHHFAKAIIKEESYVDPQSPAGEKLKLIRQVQLTRKIDTPLFNMHPIHWCANFGWGDLCELLVKKGVDVNVPTKNGDTPLHQAVKNKQYDAARILMKLGANPKAKNKYGDTALSEAKESKDKQMIHILKGKS